MRPDRAVRFLIISRMTMMTSQKRGVINAVALPSGAPAVWLLVSTLRKFLPTWPSPYAHALWIVFPEAVGAGGAATWVDRQACEQRDQEQASSSGLPGGGSRLGAAPCEAEESQLGLLGFRSIGVTSPSESHHRLEQSRENWVRRMLRC